MKWIQIMKERGNSHVQRSFRRAGMAKFYLWERFKVHTRKGDGLPRDGNFESINIRFTN
ncbi:hypothetical protein RB153_20375 [Paenibacillus larvae]|nr:hypothetical protein [Paenibacillus larvae]